MKTASQIEIADQLVFDDLDEPEEVVFVARSTHGAALIWTESCEVHEPMSFDPSAFVPVTGDA